MANKDDQNQGKGFFREGDPMGDKHREAGKQGGENVAEERDEEFYSQISRKGGEARKNQGDKDSNLDDEGADAPWGRGTDEEDEI